MNTLSEDTRNYYRFHALESNIQNLIPQGTDIMPIIDTKTNTITTATLQRHCKFAIKSSQAPKDEDGTFQLLQMILITQYDIPADVFAGDKWHTPKGGLFMMPNEYEMSIRLWSSKQVGKNVIYELTLSGYKDAIPQPMKK
jgi:hypothetical protein